MVTMVHTDAQHHAELRDLTPLGLWQAGLLRALVVRPPADRKL